MKLTLAVLLGMSSALCVWAQGPEPQPAPAAPRANPPTPASSPGFLGKDLPAFNPGNELFTWDGKNWSISNNRVFEARFEKYLNAPEESSEDEKKYRRIIREILDKLSPKTFSTKSVDEAFRLLSKASDFEIDAHLCDSLGDAVYSAWRAMDANQRLAQANEGLEQERKQHEWNSQMAANEDHVEAPPHNKDAAAAWNKEQQLKRDTRMHPYVTRLAEVMALIKSNQLKKELSELQTKIEFQALIMQLFLQRRFEHVLIATRFYRGVFGDGDTQLRVGKDAKSFFARTAGAPPTVSTLDALANEAIRDVREGVQAYEFLVEKNELESASKRLGEAFVVGEYLPEIRTLPREKKRLALEFTQQANQLVSAIEVKDYTLAEKLVHQLESSAKDFDNSKPMAAIETAKTVSAMHLAKARNAAVSGDKTTLEDELKAATEIWPRNPALAQVSGLIFKQADVQQQALVDFDQLLSQHNYRQILENRVRFIAASALYPDRQEKLAKVLHDMEIIEGAIIRSSEIAKHGDYAGAWETVEKVSRQFSDDSKLNQVRADLTTEAAEFVRTLRTAQQMEERDQVGSSLGWYLKAQKIYPASEFAKEGVDRLTKKVMPTEG
jgi:hypothetical protein